VPATELIAVEEDVVIGLYAMELMAIEIDV